jgi:hypothetical protein
MFGGTLTTVGFAINGRSTFRDTKFNFYDDLSADHFDKNQVTVPSNSSGIPVWAEQNTQDSIRGRVNSAETPACTMVNKRTQDFFDKHSIAMQMTSGLYVDQIQNLFQNDVGSLQNVCNKNESSYIPSHTLSIYIPINDPTASKPSKSPTSVTTRKVRRLIFDSICSLFVCMFVCKYVCMYRCMSSFNPFMFLFHHFQPTSARPTTAQPTGGYSPSTQWYVDWSKNGGM